MTKEIATLEELTEEIKRRPLMARFLEIHFRTNEIICPVCGNDAAPLSVVFGNDNRPRATEFTCQHCGTRLNNIHFVSRNSELHLNFNEQSDDQKRAITVLTATYLKIAHKAHTKFEPLPNFETSKEAEKPKSNDTLKPKTKTEQPQEFKAPPIIETVKDDNAALLGDNANQFFKNKFQSFIAENKKFANRKTGFSNIDAELLSFQPGIYIIGGLPALGKTTFTLQLLTQLANQGETCIFCSYEMSAGYLYSKILAREIFLIESEGFNEDIQHFNKTVKFPLPASKIVLGNFTNHEDSYKKALQKFSDNPLPLYIWQLADIDLDKLLNRIGKICANLEKPPIVCIDYLQLLTGNSDNAKSALDGVLRRLFNFRRETNATFIVVSSLNRANYQTEISFESFCGSGGIEYSADVIFGLQLLLETRTPADAEKAKKEIPRQIQLKCLKNRFGANFDVGFFYYPNADFFLPMFEYGEILNCSRADESANTNRKKEIG